MKIDDLYTLYTQEYKVDTDTRNIRKNSLFFALKGANFNGNEFAEQALDKGASYVIIDEKKFKVNNKCILVDNVLNTLQELANYHRNQLNIPFIALTGSNGKTTTKELINAVLSKKYKTVATKGNLNNHIGVPLTLLSIRLDTEIAIVEMGANHQNEIAFLSSIVEPDFGYITNFGKAHLEGFGSVEGVIKGKSELYDFLIENNKSVFINPDDKIQVAKTRNAKRIPFNESISFLEANPYVKLSFNNTILQSKLIGSYNYNNIAAAITIGNYFNVEKDQIINAIQSYSPTNNRSQIIAKNDFKIILDAYNANPSSMNAALDNLSLLNDVSKIAILGDMFELGTDSEYEHQNIVNLARNKGLHAIFIGKQFFNTDANEKYESFEEFISSFNIEKYRNSTILIKGSRGMALERILNYIN